MIIPYKNVPAHLLNDFVSETTIADHKEDVVKAICLFIHRNNCSYEVKGFLAQFLLDEKLLEKTVIVNSNRYYQTSFLINKDKIIHERETEYQETLELYKEEAELIFLNLTTLYKTVRYHPYMQNDRDHWEQLINEEKYAVLDVLFDERNLYLALYELTNIDEYKEKSQKWLNVIRYFCK